MKPFEPIENFIEGFGSLSRDVFVDRFENPFIVVNLPSAAADSDDSTSTRHKKSTKRTVMSGEESEKSHLVTLVAEVTKADQNAAGSLITVGRSEENDVPLGNPSISSHHANFYLDPNTRVSSIEDVGSSYGTIVDGKSLPPGKILPLKSGTTIVFARTIQCTFLYPKEFFDYIQALVRLRKG